MKIRFTNKYGSWDASHTGKGKFAQRIIDEWTRNGVSVTQDVNEYVDIDLQIQRFVYEPRYCKKIVLRAGPVEYDTNIDYQTKNKELRHCQKHTDGIIYQSAFAEKAQRTLVWDSTKPSTVIFNGADPRYYESLTPWPSEFKVNFIASTREWVWEKRLVDLIEAFNNANIDSSCLWVLGSVWDYPKRFPPFQKGLAKKVGRKNIRFMGKCSDEIIGRFYRMATCLLHAVYIDACPNAIAEALSALCPVLATHIGGQAEFASNVVRCDPEWDFTPRNRRKPPPLNISEFSKMMISMANNTSSAIDTTVCDIRYTARQYLNFFRMLLGDEMQ
jgi:glycosyltransferase involved in cell wall biosynthesis